MVEEDRWNQMTLQLATLPWQKLLDLIAECFDTGKLPQQLTELGNNGVNPQVRWRF